MSDRHPLTTGPAVVLSGRWLAVARQAVHNATVARRRNGLPQSGDYASLLESLNLAMSRTRQCVTPVSVVEPSSEPDWMTVEETMNVLERSRRTVQRMAPRLGGRLIGGRWVLDRRAVEEHRAGRG